jgi:hypothetical protein
MICDLLEWKGGTSGWFMIHGKWDEEYVYGGT